MNDKASDDLWSLNSLRSTVHVALVKTQSFEPPSTWMVSPVIHRASSDARKAITPPMSSGCAMRLSACIPRTNSRPASVLVKFDMSVSTTPGATALTRIPRAPSIEAKCFTRVSMAPLVAAYAGAVPTTARAASDETKTMLLPFDRIGRSCCTRKNGADVDGEQLIGVLGG